MIIGNIGHWTESTKYICGQCKNQGSFEFAYRGKCRVVLSNKFGIFIKVKILSFWEKRQCSIKVCFECSVKNYFLLYTNLVLTNITLIVDGKRVISGYPATGLVTSNYCHAADRSFKTVIINAHTFSDLWLSCKRDYVALVAQMLVHFCSHCHLKTYHLTLPWSLFNIFYLEYLKPMI